MGILSASGVRGVGTVERRYKVSLVILRGDLLFSSQIGHKRQMSQFCGQEAWCNNFNSERAMMAAMRRAEDQYLVVGVTEMWEETLEVLEHLLPAFFRGALQMYRSRGRIRINSNNIKVFVGLI